MSADTQRVGVPGLFSFEVPAAWEVSRREDGAGLDLSPGGEAHGTVSVLSALAVPPLLVLEGIMREGGAAVSGQQAYTHDCGRPAARIDATPSDGVVCRAHALELKEAGVLLALTCAADQAPLVEAFEAAVASLSVPRALPVRGLVDRVTAAIAEQAPGLAVARAGDDALELSDPESDTGAAARVALAGLRRHVEAEPAREAELVAGFVDSLPLEQIAAGPPAAAPEALFPRLVPAERLEGLEVPEGYAGPATRPWEAGLLLALVASGPGGDRYVTDADLDELGLDFAAARARAVGNLDALLDSTPVEEGRGPDGRPELVRLQGHRHAAAALVSPGFRARLAERLGPEFLLCAPALDVLVAVRPDGPATAQVLGEAELTHAQDPHPVTTTVFRARAEGVAPE